MEDFFGDEIEDIFEIDTLTGKKIKKTDNIKHANSHYVTPKPTLNQATKEIRKELKLRLNQLYDQNKLLKHKGLNREQILT